MKKHLPKKTHAQRIENRVSEGMPDSYICMDGIPIWCELKIIKRNGVALQPSQIAWHLSHSRCGGVSFFLAFAPSEGLAFLFEGSSALEIQGSRACDLRPLSIWEGPVSDAPCALRLMAIKGWALPAPATCAPML